MTKHDEPRLYVSWRHPDGWIRPVGVLTRRIQGDEESYRFVYLKSAESLDGFSVLPGLPDLHRVYESEELFALFRNRQMPRSRPDYAEYVGRLNLGVDADPFEVMARNEGRKMTDRIEVFYPPVRNDDGDLTTVFFARGVRHREGAAQAITSLRSGDQLMLRDDLENAFNPRAVLLVTSCGADVGWVPEYLLDTAHELRQLVGEKAVVVRAEHVNPPGVVPHMRLLCRLTAPWPKGYQPMSDGEFEPITG